MTAKIQKGLQLLMKNTFVDPFIKKKLVPSYRKLVLS